MEKELERNSEWEEAEAPEDGELWIERLELAWERIREIPREHLTEEAFVLYFAKTAGFLLQIEETAGFIQRGGLQTASEEELLKRNHRLYEDILPGNYEESYANPAVAAAKLGEEHGKLLSFLYTELRSLTGFVYEGRMWEAVIRLELFVEVYGAFVCEWQENERLPEPESIRQILYWFVSDYADVAAKRRVRELVVTEDNFAVNLIMNSDLGDVRYLFAYGEYVGENELEMARFLAAVPEETIHTMADTYTEGYRTGFRVTGKDLSKKSTVELRYRLGFERMMRRAVENFAQMGLSAAVYRNPASILYNPGLQAQGFSGSVPNRQYLFDHKDDRALFLDKAYINRRLEVQHTAFENYKEEALGYAGPAVLETFGEDTFQPVNKPESIRMTDGQDRLWVDYRTQAGELQRRYILEEERSFTIIAFPVPEIGECFRELFWDTIRLNTLDYQLYRRIQQTIIDTLDTADYCEIKGMGDNRTDLRVNLWKLSDPESQTIFENCVADVNIPVGEVFTSPVLEGTKGILHVTSVCLEGLEYKNLEITFEEGMVTDYTCDNFAAEEENRAFIKENILARHDTLPMGEFAVGTNTTAYKVAQKYHIADKLPILIAEKTGPHFAVGDTCYSHEEDLSTCNPDGKAIVARENSCVRKRHSSPGEAYFNCHTDIMIPYDELGELTAVRKDGTRIPVLQNGRFVLPGTEELNAALDED